MHVECPAERDASFLGVREPERGNAPLVDPLRPCGDARRLDEPEEGAARKEGSKARGVTGLTLHLEGGTFIFSI